MRTVGLTCRYPDRQQTDLGPVYSGSMLRCIKKKKRKKKHLRILHSKNIVKNYNTHKNTSCSIIYQTIGPKSKALIQILLRGSHMQDEQTPKP